MSNNYISVKQNNYLSNINKFFYRLSTLRHWPGSAKSGPQCSFSFWKTISFKQLVFLSQTCSGQMPYIYSCPQVWCLRLEKSPLSFPLPFPHPFYTTSNSWFEAFNLPYAYYYYLDTGIQDASEIHMYCVFVFFFRRQVDPKSVLTQLEKWKSQQTQHLEGPVCSVGSLEILFSQLSADRRGRKASGNEIPEWGCASTW